jgi:hypothetical protein
MTGRPQDESLVRAAIHTSDDEFDAFASQRASLSAIPLELRTRRDRNRLAYVEWNLDRIMRGRVLLGSEGLARARAAIGLKKALDDFYSACAAEQRTKDS